MRFTNRAESKLAQERDQYLRYVKTIFMSFSLCICAKKLTRILSSICSTCLKGHLLRVFISIHFMHIRGFLIFCLRKKSDYGILIRLFFFTLDIYKNKLMEQNYYGQYIGQKFLHLSSPVCLLILVFTTKCICSCITCK